MVGQETNRKLLLVKLDPNSVPISRYYIGEKTLVRKTSQPSLMCSPPPHIQTHMQNERKGINEKRSRLER